jgi:hypothetical protein
MSLATGYNADRYGLDTIGYSGPDNGVSVKDMYILGRVAPKPTTVFSGVGRSSIKFTRTMELGGSLTPIGDAILSTNFSIPVGADEAEVLALLAAYAAVLASANVQTLVTDLKITY